MGRRVSPLLDLAHRAVEAALSRETDRPPLAVDATAGNGHDTVFLARCVGRSGRVLACDVQQAALDAARARLESEGLEDRVRLVLGGHERLSQWLDEFLPPTARSVGAPDSCAAVVGGGRSRKNTPLKGPPRTSEEEASRGGRDVAAAMFNLGYLPGSDKRVITRPATTLAALEALLPRVSPGGVISLHLYTGHDGGAEEAAAVLARAAVLPASDWSVLQCHLPNRQHHKEYLLLLERLQLLVVQSI